MQLRQTRLPRGLGLAGGLRRRVAIELAKPEHSAHPLNDGSPVEEKAFRLREFAEKGDALATAIFRQQGNLLGYGLADLVRVFDPGLS